MIAALLLATLLAATPDGSGPSAPATASATEQITLRLKDAELVKVPENFATLM